MHVNHWARPCLDQAKNRLHARLPCHGAWAAWSSIASLYPHPIGLKQAESGCGAKAKLLPHPIMLTRSFTLASDCGNVVKNLTGWYVWAAIYGQKIREVKSGRRRFDIVEFVQYENQQSNSDVHTLARS